jgi:alpha-1,4-glucan:alpha-1,4-glucan 6-glycosyltransferase/4-alpha-glucanotransferase
MYDGNRSGDFIGKLRALAEQHGLQASYIDIHGSHREGSAERLTQVLRALDVPLEGPEHAGEALGAAHRAHWNRAIDEVVVAWEGQGTAALRTSATVGDAAYELTVTTEDGKIVTRRGTLAELPVTNRTEIDGQVFVEHTLSLPTSLPVGYHELSLSVAGGPRAEALILSAPRRVFTPLQDGRTWGLFVPLYALRTERSRGCGDFRDLRDVTDWVARRGGSVVGTLPMLATYLDEPCEPSPYSPCSRLAWNELFLDVESIDEFATTRAASEAWNGAAAKKTTAALREAATVDYAGSMALKRAALEPMARACWKKSGPRRNALKAFAKERPELVDYARFRAATEHRKVAWPDWTGPAREGTLTDADFDPVVFEYHLYAQYNAHLQLAELGESAQRSGLGLYLDLPVGVHGAGFDTWRYRDVFATQLSTGAPPDALFQGGQNWAFPPLHPRRVVEDRYRYIIQVIRNQMRYAGVLRIDHVMGLHRIYAIPAGAPATEGMYLRYEPSHLYAILSIESHRSGVLLLGENLGTVPTEVEHAMAEHGVHGMHVVQYEARPDPEATIPPADHGSVASLNTHDMPPFASYWTGSDIDLRAKLGWLDEAAVHAQHEERARLRRAFRQFLARQVDMPSQPTWDVAMRALLRHLGRGAARLVLVNLEDLWGETHAQNVPGTYREHDNWQHRTKFTFEQWREMGEVTEPLRELAEARGQSERRAQVRHDVTRLSDDDIYFLGEGTHERLDEVLGAHSMTVDGTDGTVFAVWAPSADYVSVIGDFNQWDRGRCPLAVRGSSGVWEGFVAGVAPGDLYKLHIAGPGYSSDRADPLGFRQEAPPRTASIVTELDYDWGDRPWMERRASQASLHAPMSIYEVHLGSWMRVPEEGNRQLTYEELGSRLVDYVGEMGFTHVEFLPLMEHPFGGSWGYQTTGYFAPTSRNGSPRDLMAMVDRLHEAGIGVILDWVPSHFPIDQHALAQFDGTHLYEHADARKGFHPDWASAIFNYGRHEVRSFLVSSARYWLERYHADGLRVDAVASMLYLDYSREDGQWIPNEYGGNENLEAIGFLRQLNEMVYRVAPGADTTAEESTAWPMVSRPTYVGGLGFGYKWDMGWMHDTLRYFSHDPVHRPYHHNDLTFRMIYAWGENFVLPLSHDEVVHGKGSLLGKMPGDRWQKFANLRSLYGYMWGQPGKKLLFMGGEFGQEREWAHDTSLDWHLCADPMHDGVRRWVADLNRLYRSEPALHELDCDPAGFEWVDFSDAQNSVYSFLRRPRHGPPVLVVCNFTPVPRHGYRIGVPEGGMWIELANSDASTYGGSGLGNGGRVQAVEAYTHGRPFGLDLTLPPLSVLYLRPEWGG